MTHHPAGRAFRVRRALGNGFKAMRVAPWPMWLGGLLLIITDGCRGGWPPGLTDWGDDEHTTLLPRLLPATLQNTTPWDFNPEWFFGWLAVAVLAVVLVVLCIALALFFLQCWIQVGFIRLHVGILEARRDEVAPLFAGGDRFWAMVGWRSLAALLVGGTGLLTSLPGAVLTWFGYVAHDDVRTTLGIALMAFVTLPALAYVGMGTYLGSHAVALEGCNTSAALKRSWSLARGNRVRLLWFATVCIVLEAISLVGIVFCCVGALVTMPIARAVTEFAKTESFLLLTRGPEVSRDWRLWYPAPPPPLAPAPHALPDIPGGPNAPPAAPPPEGGDPGAG